MNHFLITKKEHKKMGRLARWMAVLALLVFAPASVWAASVDDADTVTMTVPTILSISDSTGNFTLTFSSAASGGRTNFQTVGYTVSANAMPNAALAGALSGKISAALSGIELRALTGRNFTNTGTANNAVLVESPGGEVAVGTTAVALMDKPISTGSEGRVLSGTGFVAWQGLATRTLTTSDGGSFTLTVTLKDA